MSTEDWKNKLYLGDNLDILRKYVADESVDLIYLDPPFNSNATYNILFQEKSGEKSAAQITAFDDTWQWGQDSEYAYRELVNESTKKLSDLIQAFRMFLGQNDMMAYLVMMAERLLELHRVLKSTGSIYLHCDPTASHYLKLLMDAIFGADKFLREIIWSMETSSGFKSQANLWIRGHDTILFYKKGTDYIFNKQFYPLDERTIKRYDKTDINGRKYKIYYDSVKEPRIVYLDKSKGRPITDVWTDIISFQTVNRGDEYLGYPTQKPEILLERIINASSNKGDIILDPFCGCGTAIAVAEKLHRRWIGIDITHLAITLMRNRLNDAFSNELSRYEIIGQPIDLASARDLAQESEHSGRYQFEWWALGLIDARPAHDKKKGSDKGIDGYINFFDDNSGKSKTIIAQVKSGHIGSNHIRDLIGVVEREKAQIGVYITLEEPTKPMKDEAIAAGFYEPVFFPGNYYPKIQIVTIQELLDGKKVEYPRHAPEATFKRAQRIRKDNGEEQNRLL
jgi:site-specific DNA-methyltransferase (adenine-specific)